MDARTISRRPRLGPAAARPRNRGTAARGREREAERQPAASFDGKSIRTVEGHAKNGELSVLQKAFIAHFAFQCGYCTAGFLNESQVLLERLEKKRVPRAELEKTIAEALDGHLCRCTGYIKYHEAVRDVILAD